MQTTQARMQIQLNGWNIIIYQQQQAHPDEYVADGLRRDWMPYF
jgi:hypothetical protein